MKICHVCETECEENAELCPVCGATLRDISEENAQVKENEAINFTLLATVEDVVSAEIFKDILGDNGIPFYCDGEDTVMQVTFGGGFASQDIYVDEKDFDKAKALYEEFLNSEENTEFFEDFEDLEIGEDEN